MPVENCDKSLSLALSGRTEKVDQKDVPQHISYQEGDKEAKLSQSIGQDFTSQIN